MNRQDQLEMERVIDRGADAAVVGSPKTILFHVQSDKGMNAQLETALSLARACSAHLECLHVTPVEAFVAFDGFGGVFVMSDVMKAIDDDEARMRAALEEKLGKEDVSWNYSQATGNVAATIMEQAALADLVVTGREPSRREFAGSAIGFLGDLIYGARTPLFIPASNGRPVDPTGPVLIAWDGSHEAANAIRFSIGLLRLASSVHILEIEERDKSKSFPSTRLLEYLSRHDVHAEYSAFEAKEDSKDPDVICAALTTHARNLGAAYVLMGGYAHSRVGEFVFGGVTRTMLSDATVPLLIAR